MPSGKEFTATLNAKNRTLIDLVRRSEFWACYFAPETPASLVAGLTSSLLAEVHMYGGELTRSISTALGRLASFPQHAHRIPQLMKSLLEEVPHPEMAGEDAAKLARTPELLTTERARPAAFAVAAVARLLGDEHHPLTHLGFFYLLEGTTRELAPLLHEELARRGIASPFIELHANEDAAHTAALAAKIEDIVDDDPAVADEIEFGYDCFAGVYPLPVWQEALQHAKEPD